MARRSLESPLLALIASLLVHGIGAWRLCAAPPVPCAPVRAEPTVIEIRAVASTRPSPAVPQIASRPAARAPVRALSPRARVPDALPLAAVAESEASAVRPELLATLGAGVLVPHGPDDAPAVGLPGTATQADEEVGPDPDRLAQLQALLAARATVCYPPAAARLGLTGTTAVHFCIDPRGAAIDVSVRTGSGEPLLDRAATACVVEGAGPLPPLPGCLVVPVQFRRRP